MSAFEEEIRDKKFQAATGGTARRFKAIDGVGEKTAQKVKGAFLDGGKGRIEAPRDVQDLTDEELAETTGISKNRARKVIKGAGGNPDRDETRSNTGSVSAAGIEMPHGEFVTEVSDHDKAEAKFSTSLNRGIGRSQNAAIADKGKRAPVTTDFERWKKNKGELDFPGVDTPTDDPQVLPKDLRQEQRPDTTDPDTQSVSDSTKAKQSVNAAHPDNDAFLLDDQEAAGVDDDSLYRGELFGAQAEVEDVSLTPGEAFDRVGTRTEVSGETRSRDTTPPGMSDANPEGLTSILGGGQS